MGVDLTKVVFMDKSGRDFGDLGGGGGGGRGRGGRGREGIDRAGGRPVGRLGRDRELVCLQS